MVACILTNRITGGGFDVGEGVEVGHFAGEVLAERAVFWADQRRDQVGGSGGGCDKGKFGSAGQALCDVFQVSGGHRHPQQGLGAQPKGVTGEVQVKEEDASGHEVFDSPSDGRLVPVSPRSGLVWVQ